MPRSDQIWAQDHRQPMNTVHVTAEQTMVWFDKSKKSWKMGRRPGSPFGQEDKTYWTFGWFTDSTTTQYRLLLFFWGKGRFVTKSWQIQGAYLFCVGLLTVDTVKSQQKHSIPRTPNSIKGSSSLLITSFSEVYVIGLSHRLGTLVMTQVGSLSLGLGHCWEEISILKEIYWCHTFYTAYFSKFTKNRTAAIHFW